MSDHPLVGPIFTAPATALPRKLLKGGGAPSFCWQCGNQLQRAPGKGLGLFFFNLIIGPDCEQHRIHGDCTERALLDGCKLTKEATTK